MSVIQRIPRYLVRAVSAGAVVVAAALPLAAASAAGASTPATLNSAYLTTSTKTPIIGDGATTTLNVAASGLAFNGSTVTFSSNAPGVTFSGASEASASLASATISVGGTTPAGFYNLTVTDGNGAATLNNAFEIVAAPVVTAVSPATVLAGQATSVTLTGTGFDTVNGMTASLASAVDGTPLQTGTVLVSSSTSATVTVTAVNNATTPSSAATIGAFNLTVTNKTGTTATTDTFGGNSTLNNAITVTPFGFTSSSPSYIAANASATTSVAVTLNGQNLGSFGALQVAYGTTGVFSTDTNENGWLSATSGTSTTVTATVNVPASTGPGWLDFAYTTTTGVTTYFNAGIGIGLPSLQAGNAPTVTSVSQPGPLGIGSAATLVITGTNFVPGSFTYNTSSTGYYTTAAFDIGGTSTVNPGLACTSFTVISSISATCVINGAISSTTVAGPQDLYISTQYNQTSATVNAPSTTVATTTTVNTSAGTAGALTIAGPVITSVTPSVVSVSNAAQTLTLTGTGFPTSGTTFPVTVTNATVTSPATNVATVVSSTQATLVLATVTASPVTIKINGVTATYTTSPTFSLTAGIAPTLGAASYATGTTGVGVGASGVSVTWAGTGLYPGAKLSFSGTGVTASVTAVTATSITASISVAAGTASGLQHVTVTNANGGMVTSTGTSTGDLNITAAPGGSIATASALSGATTTLSFSGGNYATGVKVTSSNSLLTVGTVTVGSGNTTMSVPVTAVAMTGTSPIVVSLTVVNPDGGTSSYSVTINAQPTVTGSYYVPTFSNNVQVVITGTGFESGMSVASSNSAYTVILGQVNPATPPSVVSTAILVVSTTSAATAGTSSNITFTNPDSGKVTFALNGGPAPTPVVKTFKVIRCVGYAMTGKTMTMTILGTGFYGQPRVMSSVGGVRVGVLHDSGTALTIRVTTSAKTPRGIHVFTVTLANGKSASLKYNQR